MTDDTRSPPPDSAAESQAQLRQIIDCARHFAIIGTDLDGRITFWSAGAAEILGWQASDMLHQPLARIFTPEDIEAEVPQQEMAAAQRDGYVLEERWHLRSNGERFWSVGELTLLTDDADNATGFAKVLQDRSAHKAAEIRLRAMNDNLTGLIAERTRERDRIWRNSLDLLLEIDPQGILRSVNPAWTAVLGYHPSELVDHHFAPFVHPDDIPATIDAITRAAQGPLVHFEVRIKHKNDGYRHIVWSGAPEGGLIYANGRDVTLEKKQAALLQLQHQTRLRLALEAGQMGVWEWDMRGGEVLLLQGADLLHGFAPSAEPIRLPSMADYLEHVHPQDRAAVLAEMQRALDQGQDHRVEYRIVWPDGRIEWLEARGTTMPDEQGSPARMSGISINITRRKRAEQDLAFLAEVSAELARLVDPQSTLDKLAHLAVPAFADWCAVDWLQDGKLVRVAVAHVDPAKVKLAHELHDRFPPDPASGTGMWQVIRSGKPTLAAELTDDMLAAAIPHAEQLQAIRELGLKSYIAVPLIGHGKVMGVVTFISAESGRIYGNDDLVLATELAQRAAVAIENAQLYQTVQQADRDKDIFLATLAHELRNPLAAIANGVSLMQLTGHDPARMQSATDVIKRQAGQLSRLVDDLLDISRITTGKIALRKERANIAAILNSALDASRPLIDAAHHAVTLHYADTAAEVYGDVTRLTQVFVNLLSNAAKFTAPRGKIEIALDCDEHECTISVRDNGVGIEADMLPNVFTLFAQGKHPLEAGYSGLGIGLALVDRLLTLHGGSVTAHSAGPGHGSEFVVRLPRAAPASGDAPSTEMNEDINADWWTHRRFVVVDDNQDAASTIADVLRLLGAQQVHVAHDGAAAVGLVQSVRPHVVLLDIGLPGIDGYEVARRIRADAQAGNALLVALTGWGQNKDRENARAAGFDVHWVKPVTLEQVRALPALFGRDNDG